MAVTGYLSERDKYNVNNKLSAKVARDADLGTVVDQARRVQRFTISYSDLVDGSAVVFGEFIPDNAVVTRTWYEVITTFVGDTDDSSTIKLGLEDQDNDVVAAVAISDVSNPWDAGFAAGIQDDTVANFLKLSAQRKLAATWTSNADSALTAGLMYVFVEWVQGG